MRCYFSDNGILGGVLAHGRVLELGDCLRPFQPKPLYEPVILHKSVHKKAVFDSWFKAVENHGSHQVKLHINPCEGVQKT